MKHLKPFGLLILALCIGLAAAVYAAGWMARQASASTTRVVVAAVDIELGHKLSPQLLTTVEWPGGAVPSGAFRDAKELQDRVLRVGVLKGDAIVDRKLAPVGAAGGLASVIAEGKRAMTVRVNDVVGVAGFALPGTFVDVMVNTQREGSAHGEATQISKTVLEQVLVLAVAQEAGRDDTKPKVVSAVTLEVSPQDAEKLDLARSVGSLSLVLRNQVDRQSVRTVGTTKHQLLDTAPPVARASAPARPAPLPLRVPAPAKAPDAVPAAPAGPCVEVVHNGARVLNCF